MTTRLAIESFVVAVAAQLTADAVRRMGGVAVKHFAHVVVRRHLMVFLAVVRRASSHPLPLEPATDGGSSVGLPTSAAAEATVPSDAPVTLCQ